MWGSLINEWIKIIYRRRNWWMTGLLVAIVILILFFQQSTMEDTEPKQWEVISGIAGMMQVVMVLSVIIAGDSVSAEFGWGTAKLLFLRPIKRYKLLLMKFIAAITAAACLSLVLFLTSYFGSGFIYGFQSFAEGGKLITLTGQMYGYSFIQLMMISSIAFALSTIFRSNAMAIGLSIFIFMSSALLNEWLRDQTWWKYSLFANWDLRMYMTSDSVGIQEGMSLGFSIVVLCGYLIFLHGLSWFLFSTRDING